MLCDKNWKNIAHCSHHGIVYVQYLKSMRPFISIFMHCPFLFIMSSIRFGILSITLSIYDNDIMTYMEMKKGYEEKSCNRVAYSKTRQMEDSDTSQFSLDFKYWSAIFWRFLKWFLFYFLIYLFLYHKTWENCQIFQWLLPDIFHHLRKVYDLWYCVKICE